MLTMFTIIMFAITISFSIPSIMIKLKIIMNWRIRQRPIRSVTRGREGFHVIVVGGGEVRGSCLELLTTIFACTKHILRTIFINPR